MSKTKGKREIDMKDNEMLSADGYDVIHIQCIGSKEYYVAEKYYEDDRKYEYISGEVDRRLSYLGVTDLSIDFKSEDYLDALKFYYANIMIEIDWLTTTQGHYSKETYQSNDCHPVDGYEDIKHKVVVLEENELRREFRNQNNQLYLAVGGFGCGRDSRGRKVYAIDLNTNEDVTLYREQLAGVLENDELPQWARNSLERIEQEESQKKRSRGEER